jgi:hypothetical protein
MAQGSNAGDWVRNCPPLIRVSTVSLCSAPIKKMIYTGAQQDVTEHKMNHPFASHHKILMRAAGSMECCYAGRGGLGQLTHRVDRHGHDSGERGDLVNCMLVVVTVRPFVSCTSLVCA